MNCQPVHFELSHSRDVKDAEATMSSLLRSNEGSVSYFSSDGICTTHVSSQ